MTGSVNGQTATGCNSTSNCH